jgi:hypothetical protein
MRVSGLERLVNTTASPTLSMGRGSRVQGVGKVRSALEDGGPVTIKVSSRLNKNFSQKFDDRSKIRLLAHFFF